MKRQRSYGDGLDEDRRRYYDRAPQQPPPPRRRGVEYEGEGFDRRKGFGGGFYDHRYRESPSPRGYGGDRAMHRSKSFSGFRREFPKGFRSERDRTRRDSGGGGGSGWRRPGGGWKDWEGVDGRRPAGRRSEASSLTPPPPPPQPSDQSQRVVGLKVEKLTKESCGVGEMEEGEVAPDPEPRGQPAAAEHPRRVDSECAKEKVLEKNEAKEADSDEGGNLGAEGKVEKNGDSAAADSAAKEEDKSMDAVMEEAEKVMDTHHEEPAPEVEEKVEGGEEERDETANVVSVLEQSNSLGAQQEAMQMQEVIQKEETSCAAGSSPDMKETEKRAVTGEEAILSESVLYQPAKEVLEMGDCKEKCALDETNIVGEEKVVVEHEVEEKVKGFDLEANSESAKVFLQPAEEQVEESKEEGLTLDLMAGKPRAEDKGKGIAFEVLSNKDNMEEGITGNGSPTIRAFNFASEPAIDQAEASNYVGTSSVKQEDDMLKIGTLDLSLSLSGNLQNYEFTCFVAKPDSPVRGTSRQSLPSSSFCTNSDGFTASMSLTNSQIFAHNPSCSLTQPSLDNYEHSVGSKPLFQRAHQVSNSTVWQVQLSNESKQKGEAIPLLHRVFHNGHASHGVFVGVNKHQNQMANDLEKQAGTSSLLSPMQSHGSHDSSSEHSRHKRQLTRERSSSCLLRSEQQEGEQLVLNGSGVIERVILKIVSEPLHLTGRMLKEMTDNSITYLREAISEMIVAADKTRQIIALQEALHKRSDLNREILQRCPHVLLEILVAIRTGLPDFIKKNSSVATTDLVEIFLNLKCRNLSCRSMLPVDDCDCKICQRKTGFCSSCMCIVCSKFDMASNTCSWVGCDVCLHWCHTDCGLRHSLIRKRGSGSRTCRANEMQFHCAACGHPSEMFGFVKEVFRTCAKEWKTDTLVRELQYVERIFSASDDVRGKRLRNFVNQMLDKLEKKAFYPEVVKYVMVFFSDDDSNLDIDPSVTLRGVPCSITEGMKEIPSSSQNTTWLPSVPLEGVPFLERVGGLTTTESSSMIRKFGEAEVRVVDKKPVIDELDSLVRLKQAEANMYQERANDARKEAESLKHIAMAKSARVEEHYATRIAKLHIGELQERRKQKLEELQVIERGHHQFLRMKTRMEANIRELLLKMEATKQNLST